MKNDLDYSYRNCCILYCRVCIGRSIRFWNNLDKNDYKEKNDCRCRADIFRTKNFHCKCGRKCRVEGIDEICSDQDSRNKFI